MTKTKLLNQLVKMVCEKEKGKKQLNAGQAREVIKVFSKLLEDKDFYKTYLLYINLVEIKK